MKEKFEELKAKVEYEKQRAKQFISEHKKEIITTVEIVGGIAITLAVGKKLCDLSNEQLIDISTEVPKAEPIAYDDEKLKEMSVTEVVDAIDDLCNEKGLSVGIFSTVLGNGSEYFNQDSYIEIFNEDDVVYQR